MTNRLARETSPYLQQHSQNPVDWYPWGAEALERARVEDKPILLSIGYSACHWCHVMERESFENEATAALMNGWFINVKVDREERPDLDQVYQLVVQLMGRSGGWPLTVFLTPDQRPFFGGTYFPPTERYGMPGFPKVLQGVWEAYRARRGEVDEQAGEITSAIARVQAGNGHGAAEITPELFARAAQKLVGRFDDVNGGFGQRPKFPNTMNLDVLLRAGDVPRVRKALDAMRAGGIWDHLGGGFHRYSTDERWLVPHFEKMLYDNAMLLGLYVDAWRATREPLYEQTARAIAGYVAREMTSPGERGGGFYATQDADSEGDEGKFFVWTPAEVDAACAGDMDAARAAKIAFDVTDAGNFEHSGATVLSTPASMDEVGATLSMTRAEAEAAVARATARMFAVREKRVKPFRDEKILASWNGLMAGALARAGAALGDGAMVEAAARALAFVERELVVRPEGGAAQLPRHEENGAEGARVLRHFKDGVARGPGFLDDHAFVADAALDLYEATGEPRWVALARAIAVAIRAHFYEAEPAGFQFSPDDGEKILVRPRDPFDHAVPGGASIASRVLLRLGTLVDPALAEPAERAIARLAGAATENPAGLSVTVGLIDRLVRGSVDVVLVGSRTSDAVRALAREAHRAHLADRTIAWLDPSDPASVEACGALAEGKVARGEATAYVCRGRTCSLPLGDPNELARALERAP